MAHITREALARYIIQTSSVSEQADVEWHLEHCAACRGQASLREIVLIAKKARERMAAATRAARRN